MIFISHSSKDDAFVDRLRKDLNRYGYTTWVDHIDIPPGKVWDEVVEEKLGQSQIMILVLSQSAVNSREVGIEWREFRSLDKVVIPIKINECSIPLLIRHLQYIDFIDFDLYDKQFARLREALPLPPKEVTKELLLDTREMQIIKLKEEATHLRRLLTGSNQILFNFPELEKLEVFHLDKEKLFVGWYDRKSGIKPDIDLSRYDAFDRGISRQHALLTKTTKGLSLTDLGSLNGTYVAERPLPPMVPVPLQNETLVRFGSLAVLVFYRYEAQNP